MNYLGIQFLIAQPQPEWWLRNINIFFFIRAGQQHCAFFHFLCVVRLTVREVKVKQMPPKPLRESAKKMSADKPVEWKKWYV